jgi:GNAT superfamily N-acetyltransferase
MTFPAYRHLLDLEPARRHLDNPKMPPVRPLAVAATVEEKQVGLALCELPTVADREAELLSLFVAEGYRGQGIGTELVERAEAEVARRGHDRLRVVYMTGKAAIEAVERVLAKRGWEEPQTRMVSVRFTVDNIASWPYLDKYPVRQGCEIFPWVEIADAERDRLKRSQAEDGWIARDLQPWDYETGCEPVTSVGMRCGGEVVGWVINHPISSSTLRFTCSYIRPDLARRGRIVPLYCESFRRLGQTQYTSCSFTTPLYHPAMAAFAIRRCGPWASYIGETRGSLKLLGPSAVSAEESSSSEQAPLGSELREEEAPSGHESGNSEPTSCNAEVTP